LTICFPESDGAANHTSGNKNNQQFPPLTSKIPDSSRYGGGISSIVKCAYHALSLDDERRTFHPVRWDESDPSDRARIQQVWFPGVHSNVGGGYPKDGLAYLSLEWMVTKAKVLGLRFIDAELTEIKQQTDPYDDLYDSRAGLSGY
jgi:Uncharacterized alpha/beta hydrolase domain (DUF2235)